jgi:hypothetical protein
MPRTQWHIFTAQGLQPVTADYAEVDTAGFLWLKRRGSQAVDIQTGLKDHPVVTMLPPDTVAIFAAGQWTSLLRLQDT